MFWVLKLSLKCTDSCELPVFILVRRLVHVFVCVTLSLLSGDGGFVETIAVHVRLHLRSQKQL